MVRVNDLASLGPHHCGFESHQGILDSVMRGFTARLWSVGGSTQVLACARNIAQRSTRDLPLPVNLESHHITFKMLVLLKTQDTNISCTALNQI